MVFPAFVFFVQVLRVEGATEPNAVRWTDLHYLRFSIWLRQLITLGITFVLVLFSAVVLQLSRLNVNTLLFSIILSTCESISL